MTLVRPLVLVVVLMLTCEIGSVETELASTLQSLKFENFPWIKLAEDVRS